MMHRREVLQAVDVGPGGNSLYVLRVVDDATDEIVEVELVDVRGLVLCSFGRYLTESGARSRANKVYSLFQQHNGNLAAVKAATQT
jgi:hypothetical protein